MLCDWELDTREVGCFMLDVLVLSFHAVQHKNTLCGGTKNRIAYSADGLARAKHSGHTDATPLGSPSDQWPTRWLQPTPDSS